MGNRNPTSDRDARGGTTSRRHALAMLLGAGGWLPGALGAAGSPVRLIVSESLVEDVNINDARAAMQIWIKRMAQDMKVVVEFNPKVFDTTEDLLRRVRSGQFDCVALNVLEYRQIADLLDSSQIICAGDVTEHYVLLAKRSSGIRQLGDLRGRRLSILKAPKMCVASAWLDTLLDEGHLGQSEQFFGTVTAEPKATRVVLPVFFGQADACLTSRTGFETMCELNPQVAQNLMTIATSPGMVVTFYIFRKDYHGMDRGSFARAYSELPATAAGRQIATLFQFDVLVIKDASILAPALAVLEKADRIRGRQGTGGRKG